MSDKTPIDPPLSDAQNEAAAVGERFVKLLEEKDVVAKICSEEILQFACDILAALDEEYTPTKVLAIMIAIGMMGQHKIEGWAKYTREDAKLVVAHMRSTGTIPRTPPDPAPWEPTH